MGCFQTSTVIPQWEILYSCFASPKIRDTTFVTNSITPPLSEVLYYKSITPSLGSNITGSPLCIHSRVFHLHISKTYLSKRYHHFVNYLELGEYGGTHRVALLLLQKYLDSHNKHLMYPIPQLYISFSLSPILPIILRKPSNPQNLTKTKIIRFVSC